MKAISLMTYVRNMGLSEVTSAKQAGFRGFPVNTLFSAHALSTHGTALGGETVEQCAAWKLRKACQRVSGGKERSS